MSLDTNDIRDRMTSRTFGWTLTRGAPDPVRQAAADYQAAMTALDDALVDYDVEVAQRTSTLKAHNAAVTEALRDGKKPPAAKVPSLEEIDVRHGAIIAARESFVREAAVAADRVAAEHYPAWRANVLAQLQAAAVALTEATVTATQTAGEWGAAAQQLARLDRTWAPRTAKLDEASVLVLLERWARAASIESTQLGQNVAGHTNRLRQMTEDPVVVEYDPAGAEEQFSAGWLAQQSPALRTILAGERAAS